MTQHSADAASSHINIIAKGKCANGSYYLKLRIPSEGKYRTEILSLDALESDQAKTPSMLRASFKASYQNSEMRDDA